ncbi:MAG: hypothetical protein MZU95_00595 [Desulfomicrobium escambiense]|nr:hypothetical protein [Desulfomicrobium escambiense]
MHGRLIRKEHGMTAMDERRAASGSADSLARGVRNRIRVLILAGMLIVALVFGISFYFALLSNQSAVAQQVPRARRGRREAQGHSHGEYGRHHGDHYRVLSPPVEHRDGTHFSPPRAPAPGSPRPGRRQAPRRGESRKTARSPRSNRPGAPPLRASVKRK